MNKRDTNTEGIAEFPTTFRLASLATSGAAKWAF
jgi:hypothetical protein